MAEDKNDNPSIHSYHIFLFPFRWDKKQDSEKEDISKRLDVYEIKTDIEKSGFEIIDYKIDLAEDYNQFVYFHDFARKAIFGIEDDIVNKYKYKVSNGAKNLFTFKLVSGKIFNLSIDKILLKIYKTGTGVLSFHVRNTKYNGFEDILLINDFGRRTYPQFIGHNFDLGATQNSFLPEYTEITIGNKIFREDFKSYTDKTKLKIKNTPRLPNFINKILNIEKAYDITPLIDDRMFVISWVGNKVISDDFKSSYKNSELWYKYIYVDSNSLTCQDNELFLEQIKHSTYQRWRDYGTLFGITRYSFVCVTDGGDFAQDVIKTHNQTMYYEMVCLCLVQRASILRFSKEIADISSKIEQNYAHTDEITELYKLYIKFLNSIYFREITAQEQGIELYDKIQKAMNLEREVKELDNEISELHSYATLIEDQQENKLMNNLQVWGFPILIFQTVLTIFSLAIWEDSVEEHLFFGLFEFYSTYLVLLISLLFAVIAHIWIKQKRK